MPAWVLPSVIKLLHPGLLADIGWFMYWSNKIREAKQHNWPAIQGHAEWCRDMHPATVIHGARSLMKEMGLRAGEFAAFRIKCIIRHIDDPFLEASELWTEILDAGPDEVITLTTSGHGEFDAHRMLIERKLTAMYAAA
jgi:hypothetical protein